MCDKKHNVEPGEETALCGFSYRDFTLALLRSDLLSGALDEKQGKKVDKRATPFVCEKSSKYAN